VKTTVRLACALGVILLTTANASAFGKLRCCRVPAYPTAPFAPVGGGSSFAMQMSMSGDVSMLMILPALFRAAERLFLPAEPGGMTEAQVANLLRAEADRIIKALAGEAKPGKPAGGASLAPSPELERARADVQRQLAAIEAAQRQGDRAPVAKSADPRAEVQRLLADIEATQASWKTPATTAVSVGRR
jgi:hypothetical protein